jgi:hypothetical protein
MQKDAAHTISGPLLPIDLPGFIDSHRFFMNSWLAASKFVVDQSPTLQIRKWAIHEAPTGDAR